MDKRHIFVVALSLWQVFPGNQLKNAKEYMLICTVLAICVHIQQTYTGLICSETWQFQIQTEKILLMV